MADVLVIHAETPLRLKLIDQLRRHSLAVAGAVDLDQARANARSAARSYAVVAIGVECAGQYATAVAQTKHAWPAAEVILVGTSTLLRDATEAVRQGAFDYAPASDPPGFAAAVRRACHEAAMATPLCSGGVPEVWDEPVMVDPATRAVFDRADRAAMFKSNVLITGESGTGKEVLARRLHAQNKRRGGKFVPVNCGSLPEGLVESELFGHKRGAFTGAGSNSKGLIEEAAGGVLFLDEIGDMPLAMQGRLLRFLDSGEIRAVGETLVRHVDVRVVAATNRDLHTEIREKRFREDLFFRLSVVPLYLPPLRDRKADLPALIEYQARRAALRLGVPIKSVSDEAMAMLVTYHWPGNIRELQNVLEEALVRDCSCLITPLDLPSHIASGSPAVWLRGPSDHPDHRRELLTVLRRHNGNHSEAASALGISRTTLWRRLKQHDTPSRLHLSPGSTVV